MKRSVFLIFFLIASLGMRAQIGYQVSLLNSATGEPRANETVSVTVAITNSNDEQIFSSTQSVTTNDFGVLSLQIGNSTTFDNVDWSKLPMFISATVDGVMVGKSQILNVPVAEAAKQLVGVPLDSICRSWSGSTTYDGPVTLTLTLNQNMTGTLSYSQPGTYVNYYFDWIISSYLKQGNMLLMNCRCTSIGSLSGLAVGYYTNGSIVIHLPGHLNVNDFTLY